MNDNRYKNYSEVVLRQFNLSLQSVETCNLMQESEKKHVNMDGYLLFFVSDGLGIIKISGRNYQVNNGFCAFIAPRDQVIVSCDAGNHLDYYLLGFSGADVVKVLDSCPLKKEKDYLFFNCNQEKSELIKKRFDLILKGGVEINQKTFIHDVGYFYLLISEMISGEDVLLKSSKDSDLVWKNICDYISSNYDQPISVDTLSEKLNCHRTTLYRLFKKNSGMSPVEYILNFRLERAYYLIVNTSSLYVDIAFKCGFNDSAYFYRLFKRKYKKTPRQVREEIL